MESLLSVSCWFLTMLLKFDTIRYCPELTSEKEPQALFTFGESLYDPGNTVYIINRESSTYWPYGETFFRDPNGRYSDGRVVPDFIATFAGLPILPPYLRPSPHRFTDGANFASAGACILYRSDEYIDFRGQVGFFMNVVKSLNQELGNIKSKKILNNAVYLISIGGPDYGTFLLQNPNATGSDKNLFVKMVIGNLTDSIKELYSLGARKFAYQNVGPLGCAPHKRIDFDNCDEDLSSMATQHNVAFSAVLDGLEEELSGFRYSIFNYYDALLDIVNDPFKYGFKESRVACCGVGFLRRTYCGEKYGNNFELCSNPFEYVWFDGDHPGEGTNHQIAKLMWSGSQNFTRPCSVQQLFRY